MSEHFTLPGPALIVAEVEPHPNGVYGTGRAERPVLVACLKFLFRGPEGPGKSLLFRELRCQVSPFEGVYIGTSLPTPLNVWLASDKTLPNEMIVFEIPLDRVRLAAIDRLRKGGDVKLRLDMELFADEYVEIGKHSGTLPEKVCGFKAHYRMFCKFPVVIPRSTWTEQVLPGTEFSKAHIIELPAVLFEKYEGLKDSKDALDHAVKLERNGYYNEAVATCRKALEPFFDYVEMSEGKGRKKRVIKIPVLKSSWETKIGKATYDWLNSCLVAVKGAGNKASHLSSHTFEQLEAQMLLAITAALISYAVKTRPDSPS